MEIILASGSKYRQQQLQKLGIKFQSIKPHIDEESLKDYSLPPEEFTLDLGEKKAKSIHDIYPHALVIGSDQVAYFEGQYLEKSKTHTEAADKLLKLQNKTHRLYTSLVLITPHTTQRYVDITELKMRTLSEKQISAYIKKDDSLDCAGGYKFEQFGQFLFESINTNDPSSIVGLPMLKLTSLLIENGVKIL